jgi:hypothetical protein
MYKKAVLAILLATGLHLQAAGPAITVYKTRTCGCCGKWVEHLRTNGFSPEVKEVASTAEARKLNGVPDNLMSCHTAVVDGYTVEGHVPAEDIHRLLKQRPKAAGLSVPGMPTGSPGMEGARRDSYSVLLFKKDGSSTVFHKYPGD